MYKYVLDIVLHCTVITCNVTQTPYLKESDGSPAQELVAAYGELKAAEEERDREIAERARARSQLAEQTSSAAQSLGVRCSPLLSSLLAVFLLFSSLRVLSFNQSVCFSLVMLIRMSKQSGSNTIMCHMIISQFPTI